MCVCVRMKKNRWSGIQGEGHAITSMCDIHDVHIRSTCDDGITPSPCFHSSVKCQPHVPFCTMLVSIFYIGRGDRVARKSTMGAS